ncbi:ribosomal protein L7/L12 [Streptomyces sp. NEAU-Y11]|nr:ribosomal protein L7/L12 [Streptomyces sp. NEAU-Y11]
MESAGDNRLQVIKVVCQAVSGLGIMEAKET